MATLGKRIYALTALGMRFPLRWSFWIAGGVYLAAFAAVQAAPGAAGQGQAPAVSARTGAELYKTSCAACHGLDGRGRERSVVGFDQPLPDFSDCSFASREQAADWFAIAHEGGPVRGFSQIMPAFGAALSEEELTKIVSHIRGFCSNKAWPRGELNLPRAFFTEKAYPEDEAVLSTGMSLSGPGSFSTDVIYEKRFGPRSQIELKFPFETASGETGAWAGGAGDLSVGFKHAFAHSLERGYIFSGGGEFSFPTGDEAAGLSKGTTVFETYLAYGQVLPRDAFLHAQAGVEIPLTDRAEKEAFWRFAVGRTFVQNRFGRAWSPMFEVIAAKEFEEGTRVNWDVVPQLQVTLNTRQHLMLSFGVQVPVNERSDRHSKFLIYFVWDWFDGGLRDGWR